MPISERIRERLTYKIYEKYGVNKKTLTICEHILLGNFSWAITVRTITLLMGVDYVYDYLSLNA
jgi:hypothetical protein